MSSQRPSRWAEFSASHRSSAPQGDEKRHSQELPRPELKPLVPLCRTENQGPRADKHVTAWASPRHGEATEVEHLPEHVQLKFTSRTADNEVVWCPVSHMWHCRTGSELVISLIPSVDSSKVSGSFNLSLTSQAANYGEDAQLSLQRDCNGFSSSWIARSFGQTDFHVKWMDEATPLQSKRNSRVFANAASLCIHPHWQEAEPSYTELVDVQVESARGPVWLLRCQLQLKNGTGQSLRCPSRVAAVETLGPSFEGLGPDAHRWKPTVPGFMATVTRCEVDIKRGAISYSVTMSPSETAATGASLIVMDRCACVQTKGSPYPLDLRDFPTGGAPWEANSAPALPVRREIITPSPPLKPRKDRVDPLDTLDPLDLPTAAEAKDDEHLWVSPSSAGRESPKKRQVLAALRATERREVAADPLAKPSSGKVSKVPLELVMQESKSSNGGQLSPKLALHNPDSQEPQSLVSPTARPLQGPMSTLLQQVGASNPWQSPTVHAETSPRRYMPSEPLPHHSGWGRKKKSKSKSPAKKQRDFAKNYW